MTGSFQSKLLFNRKDPSGSNQSEVVVYDRPRGMAERSHREASMSGLHGLSAFEISADIW